MKISEHANYLLNEFGRLQFDYAAFCKPDGESLRNEARNNLETYIAELEEDKRSLRDSNLWLKQNYEDLERDYGVMHEKMCARIDKLKGAIEILEDQQREAKNILIDKNLHIDSLYEEGYKLQQRIAELERDFDMLFRSSANKQPRKNTQTLTFEYGMESEE